MKMADTCGSLSSETLELAIRTVWSLFPFVFFPLSISLCWLGFGFTLAKSINNPVLCQSDGKLRPFWLIFLARSSVLSKTWNSLSSLNFGTPDYVFDAFVDQILAKQQKHKISIRRFKMIDLSYYLNVDNWFKILVECDIKELCLEFGTVYPNKKLPEVIFAAKALNVLRLRGFKIELPSNGIKRFYGLISLQVVGNLPKLRSVHLASCPPEFQMVDIAAPNMKDLSIISDRGDLNVLIKISACVTLKRLKLVDVVVTDQWLENLLPNILNLEIFDLYLCSSLRTVKISSNRLKYLILVSCNNLIEVDLDTPNFLGFSSDVRYGNDIVNPLPAFHLKASPLLEVKLKLIPETLDTNWYSELTKSLSNFNHSKAICLCCDGYKVSATHSLLALPE
ncbi:hypothetical protein P3S67_009951 [Capsicum chacoense]